MFGPIRVFHGSENFLAFVENLCVDKQYCLQIKPETWEMLERSVSQDSRKPEYGISQWDTEAEAW